MQWGLLSLDDIRMIEKLEMSWSRIALEQLVLDPRLVRPEGIHWNIALSQTLTLGCQATAW